MYMSNKMYDNIVAASKFIFRICTNLEQRILIYDLAYSHPRTFNNFHATFNYDSTFCLARFPFNR